MGDDKSLNLDGTLDRITGEMCMLFKKASNNPLRLHSDDHVSLSKQ